MLPLCLPRDLDRPPSVLCLGAHCDDIEIGCGGSLITLAADRDLDLRWAVFTADAARADEFRASARAYLGDDAEARLFVYEHRDGLLPHDAARVKDDFEALARRVKPDLIFTHHGDDAHQDHRLVSELTGNSFRDHLVLEYEIPKYDGDLSRPNCYQPIGEAAAEEKIERLLEHYRSQAGKGWFTADLFRALLRLRGMECRSPSGLAEAFHARKFRLAP